MSAHDKPGFWKLIEISLSLFSPHWRDEQLHELASEAPRFPQREQHADEVPVQCVDQAVHYPLHQHEDASDNRPFLQWCDQQPVLRPRLIAETTPKFRERGGRMQTVDPQVAPYQPSQRLRRIQLTGATQRVTGPQTPVPPAPANPMQLLSLDDWPDWMQRTAHPGRQYPVRRVDGSGDLLATVRPRNRYELEKLPVDELPTVPDVNRLTQDAINALPTIQFWTESDHPDFVENRWLNDPSAVAPVLQPMTNNDPAAGDKLAISAGRETDKPTSALTRLAALAVQQPTEETAEVPNAMRERAMRMLQAQQKERE